MILLFVCTGNTCRSPLATAAWQAFARPLLGAQQGGTQPGGAQQAGNGQGNSARAFASSASSAGLAALDGAPASRHTVDLAREWGVDLSQHHARQLTPDLARSAGLICTMTGDQADIIRARYNLPPERVRRLGEFAPQHTHEAPDSADILDPFGGSREAYETCAAQIRRAVEGLASTVRGGEGVKG